MVLAAAAEMRKLHLKGKKASASRVKCEEDIRSWAESIRDLLRSRQQQLIAEVNVRPEDKKEEIRFIPNPVLQSYLCDHGLGCITTTSSSSVVKPSELQLELDTWLVRPGSLVTGTVTVTIQETEAVHSALHSVTVSVTQPGDTETEVQVTSNIHRAKLKLYFEAKMEHVYSILFVIWIQN